jgi:nucleoside-diphosphate-sugar epimerase
MTSILVTGAAGFIGRHLVRRLRTDGRITATDVRARPGDISPDQWVQCDLLDRAAVLQLVRIAQPEIVVHLAARADIDETAQVDDYPANIQGVENLADAIREVGGGTRAICTSTQLVCRIGYTPTSDTDFCPSTSYGESKVRTEQIWRERAGEGAVWCLVRPTTVWGPGMNPHYLRFFEMVRRGRYFHVAREATLKSYSYVGNIVEQYRALAFAPASCVARRVFYLADYQPISLQAWADAFRREFGARAIPTVPTWMARAMARVGDGIVVAGIRRFPFTSFRLNNVLTPYQVDTGPVREVCPTLPFDMHQGVVETVRWVEAASRGA